jgi:hypothetical protein
MADRDPTAPLAVFPFLVGCPRSGTTLLQAMLDAHPQVAVPPESHFIPRLVRRFSAGWHGTAKAGRFADALFEGRRFDYWGMPRERVIGLIEENEPADVAGAVRLLFATWAADAGKTGYADKTPRYLGHVERLAALLPEARFVHLIRDGRDVSLSLAESFERGPQTAAQGALYWSERVDAGRRQGSAIGPGRYLELRYEDLASDPEPVLQRMCAFLGLAFEPAMLEPGTRAERVLAGYPAAADHRNLARPVAPRRDWRREMDPAAARDFELIAGPLLAELGYPVGTGLDGPEAERERRDLLAAEVERLRHEAYRARRKAERRAALLERQRSSRWSRLGSRLAGVSRRLGRHSPWGA